MIVSQFLFQFWSSRWNISICRSLQLSGQKRCAFSRIEMPCLYNAKKNNLESSARGWRGKLALDKWIGFGFQSHFSSHLAGLSLIEKNQWNRTVFFVKKPEKHWQTSRIQAFWIIIECQISEYKNFKKKVFEAQSELSKNCVWKKAGLQTHSYIKYKYGQLSQSHSTGKGPFLVKSFVHFVKYITAQVLKP